MLYKRNKYCKRIAGSPFYALTNKNNPISNFPNTNFIFPNYITEFGHLMFTGCKTIETYTVPSSIYNMKQCFESNDIISSLHDMSIKFVTSFIGAFNQCIKLETGPKITLSLCGNYNFENTFDECKALTRC
jgi:hypothetical protein